MTLVNASGGSWVPTWISWYVSADESKVPCAWPLYRWYKGQSVKASFGDRPSKPERGNGQVRPCEWLVPLSGVGWLRLP